MFSDHKQIEILCDKNGWTVECFSPLELRHRDGSFVKGQFARRLIDLFERAQKKNKQPKRHRSYPAESNWADKWIGKAVYFTIDPDRIYIVTAVNLRERTIFVGDAFIKPSQISIVK